MTVMIDFNHWRGSEIADAIYTNILEASWMQAVGMLKPSIKIDGNQWCCILGDLPEPTCIAGFGDSPMQAMAAFHAALNKPLKSTQ